MRTRVPCLLAALTVGSCFASAEQADCHVLTSLVEIVSACQGRRADIPFDVTATVAAPGWPNMQPVLATDGDICKVIGINTAIADLCPTNAGDVVRFTGRTTLLPCGTVEADCTDLRILGRVPPPQGTPIRPKNMQDDGNLNRLIRISGIVRNIAQDEIDTRFVLLQLNAEDESFYVSADVSGTSPRFLAALVGSEVSVVGTISESSGHRRTIGRFIMTCARSGLEVRSFSASNDMSLPDLDAIVIKKMSDLRFTSRHRTVGHVIAVFERSAFLLKTPEGALHRIRLADGSPPRFGQKALAAGFPSTDFYHLNLDSARWRPVDGIEIGPERPEDIAARSLHAGPCGQSCINPIYHGRAVRVRGIVRGTSESGQLYLDCDGLPLLVDCSGPNDVLGPLQPGSLVDVAGTCVMDTVDWNPSGNVPRIKNVLIAPRTPADIRVIARPSWWTPARLVSALAILFALLVAILVWNRILRRLVDRRSRQLVRARLAEERSAAQGRERTRLAVELHDALSQNLTGVTFQLDASLKARKTHPEAADRHLRTAIRALNSCRTELGRCLWDLRSEALDMASFGEAVRTVVQPIAGSASVTIRFLIPRNRLSDTTAHAVLRMIRELVANAVRHGQATHIRIAGDISTGMLKFSVSDDGCGFVAAEAPGPADGHFGLTGVRERLRHLGGTLSVESAPGRGTKITVTLPDPHAGNLTTTARDE